MPRIRTEAAAAQFDAALVAQGSVIYYMTCRDAEFVKIGYSVDLWSRLGQLQKIYEPYYGPMGVTATEPGGRALEQLRHWQFEHARLPGVELPGGTELFDEYDRLVSQHIAYLWHVEWGCPEKYPRPTLRGMEVPA